MILLLCMFAVRDLRGIWIPRWSLQEHQQIFNVIDTGFNHIFLQIFGNGEAYYPSEIAHSRMDDNWLKEFIRKAHMRGIRVSAWINVFYSWGYGSVSSNEKHPMNFASDWYVMDKSLLSITRYRAEELKSMRVEGYYLAPANPGVRGYLLRIIEEILKKYDFDGIHLDYIRYPNSDFIYDIYLRTLFQREYLYDPHALESEKLLSRFGTNGVSDLTAIYWSLINTNLTDFVRQINMRIKQIKPDCELSAAVKPDYMIARREFFQDWLTWVNNGYVDFVCLMAYTSDISKIVNKTLEAVNDPSKVAVGLGLYNLSPDKIKEQVKIVRSKPFGGFVIFSYPFVKENKRFLEILNE